MSSVFEDILNERGTSLSDMDLASRKAAEAASRRYEAACWLRRTVGVIGAKDLPEEPSEEEFRLALRSGLILCSAVNKIQPAAVPKIVANPGDSLVIQDGSALSAYQYFENVRNFLVAAQDISLPTFDVSDLEQGGQSSRIVNCILALKSYSEWRQMGGGGSWKFGGNVKPAVSVKAFMRKNLDPFSNSFTRSQSLDAQENNCAEENLKKVESHEMSSPLNVLVNSILLEKKPEEVPMLVEFILGKFMEEAERRIANQNELKEMEVIKCTMPNEGTFHSTVKNEGASKKKLLKQCSILDQQQRDIHFLRHDLQTARDGMEFMQMKYLEELQILGKHMHSFANAASGYRTVLEENRKLYNQVQELKGSIRVYCRVRPNFPGQSSSSTVGCIEDGNITLITSGRFGKEGHRTFTFSKVFGPSASQEEVFSDTQPLIRSVLDGYNVCIFAYGQTGSGKTYTMSGPNILNAQNMGVNYRALSDLFNLAEKRKGTFTYDISVHMIEIYNEQVRDLLVCDGVNRRLEIKMGTQNGLNVPNANLVVVNSTADVIDLMNIGLKNRIVGATALNDRSSRSHSCLTVHVKGRDLTSGTILRGCMHLVDLAGSERVYKSEVTGERLKEAQYINKSLLALGDVISSLAQKSSHVPYRNSKLTQLLQDSLGGQAKTLMFVHISPEIDSIGETISTLKFAERVSKVELGSAQVNKESGDTKELKEQVASLKEALARREGDAERFQTVTLTSDPSTMKTEAHGADALCYQTTSYRQPMEDVGNIEAQSNSAENKKNQSFDIQQSLLAGESYLLTDSTPLRVCQIRDDNEIGFGDWVDKVMVNKIENSPSHRNGNGTTLPDFFHQRYVSDGRAYLDQQYSRNGHLRKDRNEFGIQRHRFDPVITDDSDLDMATSDSSEADALWQFNLPEAICANIIGGGSKVKKTPIKSVDSPNFMSPNHVYTPSHSRKASSRIGRISRQPNSAGMDAKRNLPWGGKLNSGK